MKLTNVTSNHYRHISAYIKHLDWFELFFFDASVKQDEGDLVTSTQEATKPPRPQLLFLSLSARGRCDGCCSCFQPKGLRPWFHLQQSADNHCASTVPLRQRLACSRRTPSLSFLMSVHDSHCRSNWCAKTATSRSSGFQISVPRNVSLSRILSGVRLCLRLDKWVKTGREVAKMSLNMRREIYLSYKTVESVGLRRDWQAGCFVAYSDNEESLNLTRVQI